MLYASIMFLLFFQQVYSQSDFVQVPGASLSARYDSAMAQGKRGSDETFWIAYRFPVRPGVRITTWGDNNITITSTNTDGIEWIPDQPDNQKIGVFMLVGKSDGNAREDAATQVMSGILGAALLPRVERAMVIGLGTGSTAGWLAQLPELQRVDVAVGERRLREARHHPNHAAPKR